MADIETTVTENTETTDTEETSTEPIANESAEIAKLKAELAKAKAERDKVSKEAGDYRKQLRARQTAEEAAAEAEKERQEAIEKELNELRKERAVAITSKRVFSIVQDENIANSIANALYGAEDIDMAVDSFAKVWQAREKALRMEYGKVPPPGVGNADGPTITREQLNGMGYKDRLDFASKHPDEYNKLMGR